MPSPAANICAFCGGEKDPVTGACACAVAETSAAGADPFGAAPPAWSSTSSDRVAPGSAMPRLVAIAGPYAGQVFTLPSMGASIGREAAREVALTADGTVSRRHALLAPEGGAYMLRDEGSSNGTFVNNQRVQQQVLRSGDEIRIGGYMMRASVEPASNTSRTTLQISA